MIIYKIKFDNYWKALIPNLFCTLGMESKQNIEPNSNDINEGAATDEQENKKIQSVKCWSIDISPPQPNRKRFNKQEIAFMQEEKAKNKKKVMVQRYQPISSKPTGKGAC